MTNCERLEVIENKTVPETFSVEAINSDGDGGVDVTIFSGPDAKIRATEYASWKYQETHSAKAA